MKLLFYDAQNETAMIAALVVKFLVSKNRKNRWDNLGEKMKGKRKSIK